MTVPEQGPAPGVYSPEQITSPKDPEMACLAALRVPFPPHQVGKLPKGGALLDYVGHADVTDRLLNVDPYWTWEPLATDERGLPAYDERGNLWIRLTICGVTRIGVGDGPDPKQRISDALRNAAMRFGVALELWAKGDRQFGDASDGSPGTHDAPPEQPDWYTKTVDLIAAMPPEDKGKLRAWAEGEGLPLQPAQWDEGIASRIRQRAHILAKR